MVELWRNFSCYDADGDDQQTPAAVGVGGDSEENNTYWPPMSQATLNTIIAAQPNLYSFNDEDDFFNASVSGAAQASGCACADA